MSTKPNETSRVETLRRYGILDTPRERDFDAIAEHAARVAGAPIGLVSFVDARRQWFKAEVGLGFDETSRDLSFCQHTIAQGDLWVVPNTTEEPLLADNPFVTAENGIRFYAGAVIEAPDGSRLGTVCVLDRVPRTIDPVTQDALRMLAKQVVAMLELRLARRSLVALETTLSNTQTAGEPGEKLRSSEAEMARAQRIAHLGSWEFDVTSGAVAWSDENFRIFGFEPTSAVPNNDVYRELIHPDDLARVEAVIGAALRDRTAIDIEHRILRADTGEVRWIHVLAEARDDGSPSPHRLTGTTQDITDRKVAAQRLIRLNQVHRLLSETNEAITHSTDIGALHQETTRIAVETPGFALAAVVDAADGEVHALHTSLASVQEGTSLIEALRADGLVADAVTTARPAVSFDLARDDQRHIGRATYLASKVGSVAVFPLRVRGVIERALVLGAGEVGFFQDDELTLLTAVADDLSFAADAFVRDAMRTRAEKELETTRKQTALLLESVGEGIYGIDAAGCLVFANHVGRSLLGLGHGDMVGQPMHDLVHHRQHRHIGGSGSAVEMCPIHATLHDGLTRKVDHDHFFRFDGEPFPVEYVCAPVTDESGAISGAVVSFRDIAERLRREALDAFEGRLLEAISGDGTLTETFDAVARGVEELTRGVLCTIMVPDEEHRVLRLVTAPSMDQRFWQEVDGSSIDDDATICGRAVRQREAILLEAIDSTPTRLRRLLKDDYGIGSMWSVPVLGANDEVLAVFTLYHDRPRLPEAHERTLIERISKLLRLAIERDRKRRELRASDEFIRRTFAGAATGIAINDLKRRFILANDAFCKLVGYTFDELQTLDVTSITHPDDRESSETLIGDAIAGRRESFVHEKQYIRKDGSAVWARVSSSPVKDADDRPVGTIAVTEDIGAQKKALDALVAASSLLRIAGRIVRVGGWEYHPRSGALILSDEVHALLDFESNRIRDLQFLLAVIKPAYRDRIVDAMHRCARGGQAFDTDCEVETNAGRHLWVRIIGEADNRNDKRDRRVRGAFWDITQHRRDAERYKRLEAEASQLAGRLRTTLESISDPFFTVDREWLVTFMNPNAEVLFGVSQAEAVGRLCWEVIPTAEAGSIGVNLRRAADIHQTVLFEAGVVDDGRWFAVSAYPSSEGVAVHFRDVTDRRKAGERLLEQATLLDQAQDAILVRDLDHRILYWNKSAERIYGWSSAEAMGQSAKHLLYSDTTTLLAATSQVIENDEWTGEIEQVTKDGKRVVVSGRWSLVRDAKGNPKSILSINTDITEKKRLEQQFLRAQRMESIGTLAGGIAHDLNNVLAPILMAVSALVGEEEDEEKREDLGVIERSAERGAKMVRQLLLFARGSSGSMVPLRFGDVIAEVYRMMRDTFPKNITINLDLEEDLWEIKADPTQMHQMLTNLCVNARDAMPEGGVLTIAVEKVVLDEIYAEMNIDARAGPHVIVRVEDTGTGMGPETLERMFEPFFTTKDVGKGTGLGLSTVHAIVRGHHGFINIYSELGKGTRFKIYFPAELPTDARKQAVLEQATVPRGNGELVLVVDDEEAIRTVTRRTLERYGYRVMLACNGAEAVAIFAQHADEVDVVLTDMAMPVMDGPATIVALRSLKADVRIIGSSGLNANGNVSKAVDSGVKHFVPKPYTAEAMLRVLKRILVEPKP